MSSSNEAALINRLAGPGLVAVLAVLFAGRASAPRYTSARPSLDRGTTSEGVVAGALLTEDPLAVSAAVEAAAAAATVAGVAASAPPTHPEPAAGQACSARGCAPCLRAELADKACARGPVLLLCELLRSGRGDEDRERRLRDRQATLYALLDAGFRPAEREAMRYIVLEGRVFPFEWFSAAGAAQGSEAPRYREVLVLWLDEGADGGQPVGTLVHALSAVMHPKQSTQVEVAVVGPSSTDELLELLDDPAWEDPAVRALPLRILSPAATASPLFEQRLAELNAGFESPRVQSTIGGDPALASLLVGELAERIPALMFGSGEARVAILAEANTGYGSEWLKNLERAAHELGVSCDVTPIPFVSPIDGQGVATGALRSADPLDPDYPFGPTQIDYLRRIGDQLNRACSEDAAYDAIGVFATDVYDTLMILQALRPRFPHALFFTTDLDARFVHEDHLPYTRNLIVASHFGLSDRGGQGVEFRDTYQLSLCRAVRLALYDKEADNPPPCLHEIGRTRAVALNLPEKGRPPGGASPTLDRSRMVRLSGDVVAAVCGWFDREVRAETEPGASSAGGRSSSARRPSGNWPFLGAVASGAVICLLFGLVIYVPAGKRSGPGWKAVLAALLLFVAAGIALLAHAGSSVAVAQEPLVFDEGVSIWPSVLLRLGVLFYSLYGIAHVRGVLCAAADELLGAERDARPVPKAGLRELGRWLFGNGQTLPLDHAWAGIRSFIFSRKLLLRLFLYVGLVPLLCGPFFMLSTVPPPPSRGAFAFVVERVTLFLCLLAFFALFSYVLETMYLARRLIARIADLDTSTLPRRLQRRVCAESASHGKQGAPFPKATLEHRERLDLVRTVTRRVENLVYLPMVSVCLLILARASLIDAWSWPPILVGTLLTFFLLLLGCVVGLRTAAKRLMREALAHVEQQRFERSGDEPVRKRLELVKEQLLAFRGGAFSPLLEHPLVRSTLVVATTMLALEQDFVSSILQWI